MRKSAYLTAMVVTLAAPTTSIAVPSNPRVTPQEWRLLPRECMYVEGAPSVHLRGQYTRDSTWVHMHHYCWALVQEARTFRSSVPRHVADQYMDAAIENLDYVIARSKPGFGFRPDMFVRKARLLARRGRFVEAVAASRQLIAESPELPEGYIALADVQIKAGRRDQALETLDRGEAAVKDKERFLSMKEQLRLR